MTSTATKQKVIDLIIQSRGRSIHSNSPTEAIFRTQTLAELFKKHQHQGDEILRYFPVAAIALLESFFRAAVKEIIDADPKYAKNAEKLVRDIKFNLEAILAFQGKQITVGEFIAHHLPFSRIEHLNVLSELLGIDFLGAIKTIHNRWKHEVEDAPKTPIISNAGKTFADVQRIFEIRHVICHEWGTRVDWDDAGLEQYLHSVLLFTEACNELLSESLHPGQPLTQSAMNQDAHEKLQKSLTELEAFNSQIIEYLKERGDDRLQEFIDAAACWETYMKNWAEFQANEYRGGSIMPLIYAGEAESVVNTRIEQLKNWLEVAVAQEL